jgi:hypothetical protein
MKVALVLVLVASFGCNGGRKKSVPVEVEEMPDTARDDAGTAGRPHLARRPPEIAVPLTAHKGVLLADGGAYPDGGELVLLPNNVVVTFVRAHSVGRGSVAIAFTLDNKADEKLPVRAAKDTEARQTVDGKPATLDRDPKVVASCDGTVPPHSRFDCNVVYRFGDETPRDIWVGAANTLFHVLVEQNGEKP